MIITLKYICATSVLKINAICHIIRDAEPESNTIPPLGTCGKTKVVHGKIVGGQPAELHGWPWIAALGFKVRILSFSRMTTKNPIKKLTSYFNIFFFFYRIRMIRRKRARLNFCAEEA